MISAQSAGHAEIPFERDTFYLLSFPVDFKPCRAVQSYCLRGRSCLAGVSIFPISHASIIRVVILCIVQ